MKTFENSSGKLCYLLVCICSLVAITFFGACKKEKAQAGKQHNPGEPIQLTGFSPSEGGARDKILLDGANFGADPSKIKVYFNRAPASVISSNGDRIYAIVPRLPGDDCQISVVIGEDSVTYSNTFTYHTTALVSTVTGNGSTEFKGGSLAEAQIYARYVAADREGNVYASFRDGGFYGVARINEKENIVAPLIVNKDTKILNPNAVTVDPVTGIVAVPDDGVKEMYFTFDPREAWAPRQRTIKYTPAQLNSIVTGDRFKNFMNFCPYDGYIYTRHRDGTITKINPQTLEPTIIFKTPVGTNYGQAFNPKKPWLLYITFHSNIISEFRQSISVLDVRDPEGTGGLQRLNAPGGSGHRDGPVEDAVFNYPRQIAFDQDGNMFVADYSNHCIRMVTADGIVKTIAGQPGVAGYRDGGPTEALFNSPWGVAVDKDGVIYISDYGNKRIRKLVIE